MCVSQSSFTSKELKNSVDYMLFFIIIAVKAQVDPNENYDIFNERIKNFVHYAEDSYFARQGYPAVKVDFLLDERYLIQSGSNYSQGQPVLSYSLQVL